jgi:hypothetical protein
MDEEPELTVRDLTHLRHCVELAREALGDELFGSVRVDGEWAVLRGDRDRTAGRLMAVAS